MSESASASCSAAITRMRSAEDGVEDGALAIAAALDVELGVSGLKAGVGVSLHDTSIAARSPSVGLPSALNAAFPARSTYRRAGCLRARAPRSRAAFP